MFHKICFVGAGSMAEAVIGGLVHGQVLKPEQIHVTNRKNEDRLDHLQKHFGVICTSDKQTALDQADIVILATKPQDAAEAIKAIEPHLAPEQLMVSVVAGLSTERMEAQFGEDMPVVRAMPNTSAAVGASATAVCKGTFATDEHLKAAEVMFQTIGTTTVVAEADMHIVTAISGSGPAYIYYLSEAMEEAALDAGLASEVARSLLTQTIVGAGAMLESSSEDPGVLRQNITSPNGTTEAGLSALQDNDFANIVKTCVKQAQNRSIELGKS